MCSKKRFSETIFSVPCYFHYITIFSSFSDLGFSRSTGIRSSAPPDLGRYAALGTTSTFHPRPNRAGLNNPYRVPANSSRRRTSRAQIHAVSQPEKHSASSVQPPSQSSTGPTPSPTTSGSIEDSSTSGTSSDSYSSVKTAIDLNAISVVGS